MAKQAAVKSRVVVVRAERSPMPGVKNPGPHQIYRNPVVTVEPRRLGALHPDEIRVEMVYAGICGTDLHVVEANPQTGYIKSSAPARIPPEGRIIGHEGVGRVMAVGSHVRHVKVGRYVTFESIVVCHYCDVCRRGQFNQCRLARLMGLEKDGLFGTVVDVPSLLTHDVTALAGTANGLKAAACVEPAGVAYVACQSTQVTGGDEVVIFGAGPIGVLAAMLCKLVFGAAGVHVVEPVAYRRKFVQKWCDKVYTPEEFFRHPPRLVDVVIEASGQVDNVGRIFRRLNANGRVVLLARSGTGLCLDAVDHLITNAITIVGSRGHLCGAFDTILHLYQSGRLPLDEIVTHVVEGVDQLGAVLQTPGKVLNENCKVLAHF